MGTTGVLHDDGLIRDGWLPGDVVIVVEDTLEDASDEAPWWRNLRTGAVEGWYRWRFQPLPEDQT